MLETIIGWIWATVAIYAIVGIAFAIPFLGRWAGRMDPAAKTGTWGFRAAVLPATVLLWPVLALKVSRGDRGRPTDAEWPLRPAAQRRLHGVTFALIAVAGPLLGGAALWLRPDDVPARVNLAPAPATGAVSISPVNATRLPIRGEVRAGPAGRELRLDVARGLDDPVVAVYWSPAAAPDGTGPDAVFLGAVWGPTRLSLPLPAASAPGVLTFLALAGEQRVLEILPLP